MAEPHKPIHTNPKTDSQLRSVLNRLQKSQVTLVAELGELEDVFLREGTASVAVAKFDVLYVPSSGNVAPAQANAAGTSVVAGMALNAAAIGANVVYLTLGTVIAMSGLTAGAKYYLSATTPGAITSAAPSTAGQHVVLLGRALKTTDFLFAPSQPILL